VTAISVPAIGPRSSRILLVGKAPGMEEVNASPPRPHIGRNGREQRLICARHGINTHAIRMTNLIREFVPPDAKISEHLSADRIDYWHRDLLAEIEETRPLIIVPVGLDATRFFLGSGAALSTVHGIPHRPGALDPGVAYRAGPEQDRCCIIPMTQPAAGFHNSDARGGIEWDFSQLAKVVQMVKGGREKEIPYRYDRWANGKANYSDISGRELDEILDLFDPDVLAIDTEGTPNDQFCWQVSFEEGSAYMIRCDMRDGSGREDFHVAVRALQKHADRGCVFTGHNISMYDLAMLRRKGLDLFHAKVHDTLFDNYLFCLEPLGLKPSSWRTLGARMRTHTETVGELGRELQIEWLKKVVVHTRSWPKPDSVWELKGDGEYKITWNPQPIHKRAQAIIDKYTKECLVAEYGEDEEGGDSSAGEDGEDINQAIDSNDEKLIGVDPAKGWRAIRDSLSDLARRAEQELGPIPYGTMREVWKRDKDSALQYSCDDAHNSLRLYHPYMRRLKEEGKEQLAEEFSINMHIYSEMQENGMPCSRKRLIELRDRLTESMVQISRDIARRYNGRVPFNPKSPPQVNRLFAKLGIRGTKRNKPNKKGERTVSTGNKSIGHLKFIDEGMDRKEKHKRELVVDIFRWRSHQTTRDSFTRPTIAMTEGQVSDGRSDPDVVWARGQIKPWGTTTRRSAMAKPNLLAQPKHSIYGRWVRDCYVAPEGWVFIESDLTSVEVAVMAHLSRGPELIAAVKRGKFHKHTASKLFNVEVENVDDNQKTVGKRAFFGPIYGQSGPGLREQLWMQGLTQYTDDDAQRFIDRIKYEIYPSVGKYEAKIAHELRYGKKDDHSTAGSVRSMSGMQRYLGGIFSEDKSVVAEAIRQAVNHTVQGSAQDLLQRSMTWLKNRVWEMREIEGVGILWALTIHDSLIVLALHDDAEYVKEQLEEGLTKHHGYELINGIVVGAESKIAETWGGLGD